MGWKGREMKHWNMAIAFVVGALSGGAIAAALLKGGNDCDITAINPLIMQVLVSDCLALKGHPTPKYPPGYPEMAYRVDCMR